MEFRKITALCGTDPNSRHLEFKACFDTTTPTPTPKTSGFAFTGEFHSKTQGIDGSEGAFSLFHSYFNKGCSNVSVNSDGKTELRVKRCDSIGGCVDSNGDANVFNENNTIGGTKYANYTYFLKETPVTITGDTDSMVINFRLEAYAETVVPMLIFWQNGSFFHIGLSTMQGTANHVRTIDNYTVTQDLLPALSRISADDWPNNPHKFNFNKGESFYVGLAFGLSGASCYDHLVRIDKFEIDFGSNFTSIDPTPTPVPQQSGGSTGNTDSSQSSSNSELNCVEIKNNLEDYYPDWPVELINNRLFDLDQTCKIVAKW